MLLFPGLVPLESSLQAAARARIDKAGIRILRMFRSSVDVRGRDARGDEVRRVRPPVEGARVTAHLDHQPRGRSCKRTGVAAALALCCLLEIAEIVAEKLAQIRPPRTLPGHREDLSRWRGVFADRGPGGDPHFLNGVALARRDLKARLEVRLVVLHRGQIAAQGGAAGQGDAEQGKRQGGEGETQQSERYLHGLLMKSTCGGTT